MKTDTQLARTATYKVMCAERNASGVKHDAQDEAFYMRDFTELANRARKEGVQPIRIVRWIIASYFPGQGSFVSYAMTF